MSLFVGYHGVPASEHQARFDELSAEGYRITSLNVSGHPADARYAVVWIQREGPAWVAMHGISAAEYQTRFDTLVGEGYAPVLVSATGGDADAVYAAVFEASHTMPWFARHGVKWGDPGMEGTINFENQKAFDHGYVPICLAVYGTPGDERFAGIWVKNDKPVPWAWWWTDPTAYQNYFNADVEAGTRLAYVSVAPSQWILSVFRDEPIGEWYARHGLTADDYQAEFDARTADGLEPLVVQAGGSGADKRYACVFVRSDTPIDREWHMRGPLVYHGSILDGIAAHFMKSHAIRAMSIAIARAERLLAQRAYTWAEPGYPITQPDALFRVASVSKVFTCACIDQLVRDEALMQSTQAFPFLGITTKLMGFQNPDPDIDKITVWDLAKRKSGLGHDYGNDLRTISGLLGRHGAPSRDDLVRYVYGEPLVARPGTGDNYSNSAFEVLTSVVEKASNQSYFDYLESVVLAPLGISDVFVGATASNARLPGEVAGYDHPGVSPSFVDMSLGAVAPNVYGGQVVTENSEGVGGLITSSGTVARFVASHAVWNIGGREPGTRYGEMDGTGAGVTCRDDGLDFCYAFNRSVTKPEHDDLTARLNDFLNRHGSEL